MRAGFVAFLSVPLCMLSACQLIGKSGASKAAHVPGEVVAHPSPSQWMETSTAVFSKAAKVPEGFIVPSDDVLSRQVQGWVDAIDATARSLNPEGTRQVPKPRALVIKAPEMNAFVAPASVCFEGARVIVNERPRGEPISNPEVAWFDPPTSRILGQTRSDCAVVVADKALLADALETFNAKVLASDGCRLRFDGTAVTLSGRCVVLENMGAAGMLAFPRTMNVVAVYAGILARLSEEAAFAVIAHELGHYYRAHSTGSPDTDQYFYEETMRASPVRPPRLSDESLRARFDLLASVSNEEFLPLEEGMTLHPSMLRNLSRSTLMGRIGRSVCPGQPCQVPCADAQRALDEFKETLKRYVQGEPFSAVEKSRYLETEAKLNGCFKDIRLGEGPGAVGAFQVQNAFDLSAEQFAPLAPPSGLLGDAVRNISSQRLGKQREIERALTEMAGRGLGFYTVEEEADNFSLEILARNGMKPTAAKEVYFRILRDRELTQAEAPKRTVSAAMLYDYARCKALDEAGWRVDGRPVIIPFGVSREPHHAECYRVFNVDREIRAHSYAPGGNRPPLLLPWDKIATRASDAAVQGWSRPEN